MKTLLRLALFLLPLVVITAFIEYQLYKLPNSYSKKKEYLYASADSIRVLVLGSSHSLHGIDPGYFSFKGFNLAGTSQSLFYDKELTELNLAKMPLLKVVIIDISYFSFWSQLRDSPEAWRNYFYYRYWGVSDPEMPFFNAKRFSMIALYTVNITRDIIKGGFKSDWIGGSTSMKINGSDCDEPAVKTSSLLISDSTGRARVLFMHKSFHKERISENYAYLSELISTLQKKNIAAVIISTPTYKTFNKYLSPEILNQNKTLIENICRQYNCRYYDYSNSNEFTIDDFSDNDHLNANGARKFSLMLNREVIMSAPGEK